MLEAKHKVQMMSGMNKLLDAKRAQILRMLCEGAWFRICPFWVTQGARKPPACEGRIATGRVGPMREAASLPASSALKLKRSHAQQGQPVRMTLAGHGTAARLGVVTLSGLIRSEARLVLAGVRHETVPACQATCKTGPSAISVQVWGCRDTFRPLGGSGGGAARTRRGRTWFA